MIPVVESKRVMGWACNIMEREEANTGSWWGNLRERDQLEDLGVD
jgi:hypothetical protein